MLAGSDGAVGGLANLAPVVVAQDELERGFAVAAEAAEGDASATVEEGSLAGVAREALDGTDARVVLRGGGRGGGARMVLGRTSRGQRR